MNSWQAESAPTLGGAINDIAATDRQARCYFVAWIDDEGGVCVDSRGPATLLANIAELAKVVCERTEAEDAHGVSPAAHLAAPLVASVLARARCMGA